MGVYGGYILVLLFTCFTLTQQQIGFSGCECNIYRCEGIKCRNGETCFTFTCECACGWNCEKKVSWTPPSGWNGSTPALYQSFDTTYGFTLMAETPQSSTSILVLGKNNKAVKLDATQRQWLDLGIHTEACLTQLDTCGSKGGALSMWIKVGSSTYTGIITTQQHSHNVRGFTIEASFDYITTHMYVPGGSFYHFQYRPSDDWFHIVINYFGPNNGEGFNTYFNGDIAFTDNALQEDYTGPGNGRIVIGRSFTEIDDYYTSIQMDDLCFFNEVLSAQDIKYLYNI